MSKIKAFFWYASKYYAVGMSIYIRNSNFLHI